MKKYLKESKGLLFLTIIFTALLQLVALSVAFILQRIIDSANTHSVSMLSQCVLIAVIYIIIFLVIEYLQRFSVAKLKAKFLLRVKEEMAKGLLSMQLTDFMSKNTAYYVSTFNNDLRSIETDYFDTCITVASNVFMFIFAIAFLVSISVEITVTSFIFALFPFVVPLVFTKALSQSRMRSLESLERYNEKLKDIFSGFEIIKTFAIVPRMLAMHGISNREVESERYKYDIQNAHTNILTLTLSIVMQFAVFIVSGYLAISKGMTIGVMVAALQLCGMTVQPIENIARGITRIRSIKPVEAKILTLANIENSEKESPVETSFSSKITVSDIVYSYGTTNNALNGVNLTIEKGKKYALVGASGSGKSTLAKLLVGYTKEYSGTVLFDGVDVRNIDTLSLSRMIAIMHQSTFLFDDTLLNNITLFSEFSPTKVDWAITLSGLNHFVPNYDAAAKYMISENGKNISGGEKQRISIARALLANSSILILDEATASLDNNSAYEIEKSILDMKNLTCITITHRLTMEILRKYDHIFVMRAGSIVEEGTFEELIKKDKYFASLYYISSTE